MKTKFSVLISVYYKEQPDFFDAALNSVVKQSLQPDEIILVKDGPLTPVLNAVIQKYEAAYPSLFKVIALEKNVGLGIALNTGLKLCNYEIVVRMDSDDICLENRFQKLIAFIDDNPTISAVGSAIEEFNSYPGDLGVFRTLPADPESLIKFSKFRNPLNHPSVAFRKTDILKVGGYIDMPLFEDYYLWVRLMADGYKIANINERLLHFRTGTNMIGRRHGLEYLKNEYNFLKEIKKLKFISNSEYIFSVGVKSPLRLLPLNVLKLIYKTFLR